MLASFQPNSKRRQFCLDHFPDLGQIQSALPGFAQHLMQAGLNQLSPFLATAFVGPGGDGHALAPHCFQHVLRLQLQIRAGHRVRIDRQFAGLSQDASFEQYLSRELPLSRYTQSAPRPDKWRQNEEAISRVLPQVAEVATRLGRWPLTSAPV